MGLRLGLLLLALFFFLIFFVAGSFVYKGAYDNKYSIKRMLPFEFNYGGLFAKNFIANITFVLSLVCFIIYSVIFNDSAYSLGGLSASLIFGILVATCIGLVYFIPLKSIRIHGVCDALLFSLSFAYNGSILISCFQIYQSDVANKTVPIIVLVLVILEMIVLLANVMNPRLSLTIKADKVIENGKEEYLRPKFIPLAFCEWCYILANYFNLILIFILMLAF